MKPFCSRNRVRHGAAQAPCGRSGVVAIQVVVMLGAIFAFAALTVDVGRIYVVHGELQAAADSAALAGASGLATDEMLKVRLGTADSEPQEVTARAHSFAAMHDTLGQTTYAASSDIIVGYLDPANPDATVNPNAPASTFNAVQVALRRTSDGPNGAIPFQFANVFGRKYGQASKTAIAIFDDRLAGYTPPQTSGPLIPLVILDTRYEDELVNGPDNFSYDADFDEVSSGGDGVPEVRLFPEKVKRSDSSDGAGNFGLLNIGNPNQGVPLLREQIENGVTPDDLEAEIGQSELTFVDDNGDTQTYLMTGSPGVKAGLESALESRVGDVVGFFLYSSVTGSGANATFTIVGVRFGRMMEVELSGNNKRVVVQPVVFNGDGVRVDPSAETTEGMVGRLLLFR